MDKKKLLILILVVIGVLAFMALGAGAYRGNRDPIPSAEEEPDTGIKVLDKATGWMRSSLDLERMVGCNRSGRSIPVSGPCEVVIGPGPRPSKFKLPSEFKLRPMGAVLLCFAPTRTMLEDCKNRRDDLEPRQLDEEKRFTVAKDSAFLYFACIGSGSCGVEVAD